MRGALTMRDGQIAIIADASGSLLATVDDSKFTAIGYRQTKLAAAAGGKANANGFRIKNTALAALAATFSGKPFITGHDWGDARARGGTITAARLDDSSTADTAMMLFDIEATADWAIEGLKNGTVDRFSFGVRGTGELTCTVHGTPVFGDCFCFPGETVTMKPKGQPDRKVIAEWEYDGATGLELSAVNVPAVEGTGIVRNSDDGADLAILEQLCGRKRIIAAATPAIAAPALAPAAPAPAPVPDPLPTDDALMAALGLTAGASRADVLARVALLSADRARVQSLEAESLAAHVDREIDRAQRQKSIPSDVVADLRAVAATNGRAAFDQGLSFARRTAGPAEMMAPMLGSAPVLMSSAPEAATPGIPQFGTEGPDAFEITRMNANMPLLMHACGVTPDEVRKFGPRSFKVEPRLREVIAATEARGDRMGVPK